MKPTDQLRLKMSDFTRCIAQSCDGRKEFLILGQFMKKSFWLTIEEAGKSKIKVLASSVSSETIPFFQDGT
jgi:hypothetical protein